MRRALWMVCLAGMCFVCGCSEQRTSTAEFSIELPRNWVEITKPLFDPKGALSPDGRILHVSTKGYESPEWATRISSSKYGRLIVTHFKVQPSGFAIMQLNPFFEALVAMDDPGALREKGVADLGGRRVPWYIEKAFIPVSGQKQVLVPGTALPGVQATGKGYVDQFMNILYFNYVFEKGPGDFYSVSFQAKERDFPAMRSMFEGLAKTFRLK